MIQSTPQTNYYKPAGIPMRELEQIILSLDEYEAMRLADFEGLYHEKAAEEMNISRQTFGRIIQGARHKIASALVTGKAIRIDGGIVAFKNNIENNMNYGTSES